MLKLRLQLFATQTTETAGLSAEMKTFYGSISRFS